MAQLVCRDTGDTYPLDDVRWRSESGGLLDIIFQPEFDPEVIARRPANLWRYRETLPIAPDAKLVSFGSGLTPMVPVQIGGRSVQMKLDYLFPSGSYKDRGAAILITQAKAIGVKKVVQDSSGNAGCAVAAYCAKAGLDCEIFVPADTSPGKLAQIALYGAQLNKVPGSREATAQAAMTAAETTFYASHVWNPFFFQGTKTFAYEICEQNGWQAPDTVILPAGNGTLILGAYIGFAELQAAGIIQQIPKLVGIQSALCAPLYEAWHQELDHIPVLETSPTLAEGIAIALPQRGMQMIEYVRKTGGTFLVVAEPEIKESLLEMCQQGFYIEPTSAAVVAGVRQYVDHHAAADEQIVSVFTGHGLKSTEKMLKLLGQ